MHKIRNIIWLTLKILLVWALAALPTAALAHEGQARLLLYQYEIAPGQALEVSGINLGTDLVLQVKLVSEHTAVLLGEALGDGHGDFSQQFTLPDELPDGIYTIQAVDTSVAEQAVVLAETQFKMSETAVSRANNASQVVTFTNKQPLWQQLLLPGKIVLTLSILILPILTKWHRKRVISPLLQQSHPQKR